VEGAMAAMKPLIKRIYWIGGYGGGYNGPLGGQIPDSRVTGPPGCGHERGRQAADARQLNVRRARVVGEYRGDGGVAGNDRAAARGVRDLLPPVGADRGHGQEARGGQREVVGRQPDGGGYRRPVQPRTLRRRWLPRPSRRRQDPAGREDHRRL
jgi:hypothetical protein